MPWNTNLGNWLRGGTRGEEHVQTRSAWDTTEAAWRASPLARDDAVFDMTVATLREAVRKADIVPANPVIVELSVITDQMLSLEDIKPLEVSWRVIEEDVAAAVEFRKMLTRRKRWALEFDRHFGIAKAELSTAYARLFDLLPPSCQGQWNESAGLFTVPLVELIDRPAEAIGGLLWAFYEPDALSLDMFRRLRQTLEQNLMVASGFPADANPVEHQHRIVYPLAHRNQNAAALVETYLGRTPLASFFEMPVPFEVPEAARFEHGHIIGGTGHGKTQLLQRMIHADLVAAQHDGRSVVVIDSQGDLINKLVRLDLFDPDSPGSLADRLVLIDPSDVEYPAALNLFDAHLARVRDYRPVDRERVLNGVIELYETFFGDLLGAELTQKQGVIFKYLARLMLSMEGATIHTLMRLMEDGTHFKPHMDKLDGSARYFFQTEFFHPSFAATKKQILKRLWGVLSTPAFERMFAQTANKLDLFEATQAGKIILVSTAKDLLKRDGSALFGRFFIAMLAQAALERSTVDERERTPTYVYVDEAQEYFDDSVETILTQARKYRMSISAAHQTLDQLSPRLRSAFMANTSLKCAGGVSARDARALADELRTTPDFIEGMTRRPGKTEFAVWIRQQLPHAIRMSVPLGHVERQPTLSEDAYDELLALNRARYCGTLADVLVLDARPEPRTPEPPVATEATPSASKAEPPPPPAPPQPVQAVAARPPPPLEPPREAGKGGPKHRYLQQLVKELAEQQGFRATVEAALPHGGQADVLLERDGVSVPVEVSVSTPATWELASIRAYLAAGYQRIAVVLAKSARVEQRYRAAILDALSPEEQGRLVLLAPEDVPDFIAVLGPPPEASETVIKGYRVRVSHADLSPDEAKRRREALAKVVARSLDRQNDSQ